MTREYPIYFSRCDDQVLLFFLNHLITNLRQNIIGLGGEGELDSKKKTANLLQLNSAKMVIRIKTVHKNPNRSWQATKPVTTIAFKKLKVFPYTS